MQDIGIATNRTAAVSRPEGSPRIHLEFRGTRDTPHVTDRETRIRIIMSVGRAAELRSQLVEVVPHALEWRAGILDILETHRDDNGDPEDALQIVQRLSRYWRAKHPVA